MPTTTSSVLVRAAPYLHILYSLVTCPKAKLDAVKLRLYIDHNSSSLFSPPYYLTAHEIFWMAKAVMPRWSGMPPVTVHSTLAQILANTQPMLRPDACWEQHH